MKTDYKKQAVCRLRIAAGQIKGLEKMIVAEKYCIDIIYQSLAVKEALSSFEDFILEKHLATHVVNQIRSDQKAKAIKEILCIYKLSKRK